MNKQDAEQDVQEQLAEAWDEGYEAHHHNSWSCDGGPNKSNPYRAHQSAPTETAPQGAHCSHHTIEIKHVCLSCGADVDVSQGAPEIEHVFHAEGAHNFCDNCGVNWYIRNAIYCRQTKATTSGVVK